MKPTPTAQNIDQLARRRAGRKMGWYIHALVFLMVNIGLALLAAYTGRHFAVFAAFGWGLGLLIHGMVVFLLPPGGELRERLVRKERDHLMRNQSQP